MRNFLILIFLIGCILKVDSQTQAGPYKYILVPLQYDFLKKNDSYRLNTLTRFLLKKEGFEVYFSEGEQLPEDFFLDRCVAIYADVQKVKGAFLRTKLIILFKDCFGNVVLESEEGTSKEKNLDIAYKEALKKAFATLDFSKLNDVSSSDSENSNEVKQVQDTQKEIQDIAKKEDKETNKKVKKEVSIPEVKPEEIEIKEVKEASSKQPDPELEIIYYAQKIAGGFQLVDSVPKIVMVLLKTTSPDMFLVKDKNAMVVKKEGKWFYSENDNGQLKERPLNIKF